MKQRLIFPSGNTIPTNKVLKVKFGIDPTSDLLHLGHLIPLLEIKRLKELGHHIDIVLGTFTAQLGDPSGRDSMRPILNADLVKKNAKSILKQVERVIGTGFDVHFNHAWFESINAIELIQFFSKFTVNQMLSRESFQKRLNNGNVLGLHELLVPILQGIDSVKLTSDIEIGGTDQLFNFTVTRDIQSAVGQTPEICILTDIINGTDGRKMSKSFNNCIFLNDTADDVFGKVMSISDETMKEWWDFFVENKINDKHPMENKKFLAFTITKLIWNESLASVAQKEFESVIQQKNIPENISETKTKDLVLIIVETINCSKSEARRLLSQKAIKINGNLVLDPSITIQDGDIIKVGKRNFTKVKC